MREQHSAYYCAPVARPFPPATEEDFPSSNNSAHHFDVTDLNTISSRIESFLQSFPRIQPSYSVDIHKANADASLLITLHKSGCTLNLNSIDAVRLAADRIDDLSDCCFSSPVKSRLQIMEAVSLGIKRMTVSFPCEVMRISSVCKSVELVLRISPTDEDADRCIGASRNKWRQILSVARNKSMRVVGVATQTNDSGISSRSIDDATSTCMSALTRIREAYDLAKECGHDIRLIDVGTSIAWNYLYESSHHERCSTIVEEVSDDEDQDEVCCPTRPEVQCRSDRCPSTAAFIKSLLDYHFPQSLSLRILADHAQYLVPDDAILKKWWGMPKVRRPAPSLHTYLTSGCSSNASYVSAYRSKTKSDKSHNIINEMEHAAAQA